MKIVLTTDHAGLERCKQLQEYLQANGHDCVYYGPKEYDPNDDYPDLIYPAAKAVAAGNFDVGIVMGSSGQGEAIVANRVKGVRCALYYGPSPKPEAVDIEGHAAQDEYEILRLSKQHNNANMLSLAARFLSKTDVEKAVSIWLETRFSGLDRHNRRIQKIDTLT
jgi:ribose 5-phosphate isomerase B